MEHSSILKQTTKLTILTTVMVSVEEDASKKAVKETTEGEVDIDLDERVDKSPEVVLRIDNLVRTRLDAL